MTEIVYIGLGANLGDVVITLKSALDSLESEPAITVLDCSSFYRSKPIGPKNQPDYLNAVAKIETSLEASALLSALQKIESQHGRRRAAERWTARTLDLDILLFGQHCIKSSVLTVPHKEMPNRAFVLYPLAEIATQLIVPGLGLLEDLLLQCSQKDTVKVDAI
ncbi:MAG: 2-amino-4-hydroxy-6-hydroxymethyldihydropteridine diphosphokinase [Gammaproteobacteria bacterium]|nr:2-amino-4-hydroxy-6-hydroxymethyldihydropteridine diphosphokinase [Gammaproteobacteria bacterium]